jgi:SAM-dependent methyltransferase
MIDRPRASSRHGDGGSGTATPEHRCSRRLLRRRIHFGIIHHIPNWRASIEEVHRVIRPSGRFYFEEVTSHALARWSYRTFLEHPEHDRFGAFGFVHELETQHLHVGDRATTRFFGDFVIGVATNHDS